MQLDDKAILAAVAVKLAEERAHRMALQVRLNELIDGLPGLIVPPEPGERGPPGETGSVGLSGADGKSGDPGRDGRDGLPGLTGPAGERGERGEPGEQGAIGPAGQSGSVGEKGDPGEPGEPGEPAYPGAARGLWNETESYRAMDVVALNGSEWRAVYDDPGPCPGDGWRQGAKGVKGRPGEKGEKGEKGDRGPQGDRGSPGVSVVKMVIADFEIRLLLSDGTQLVGSLLPILERYYQEAVA